MLNLGVINVAQEDALLLQVHILSVVLRELALVDAGCTECVCGGPG